MKLSVYKNELDQNFKGDEFSALSPSAIETAIEPESASFGQYLLSLKRHPWKIVIACAASVLICYIISKRITPMYEATATLEINRETPSGVVGQDAVRSAWNDSDQFIATQMKIIQEDSVLRPLTERYHLDAENKDDPAAPVKLKQLRVVRPANTYLVQIAFRSPDPAIAADVANGIAESYLAHTFHTRLADSHGQTSFMEHQLDELRAGMEKSSMAVSDFERRLGVIDPQEKTNILSARLMQLNTEYTTAQADRIKKESDYDGLKSGSMAAAQQSDQGDDLKRLQDALNEAQRKFTEIKAHFGVVHPEYTRQAALVAELQSQLDSTRTSVTGRAQVAYQDSLQREAILKQELSQAKAAYDDLNARSFQYQTLKLEAESNRKLYNDLEQRIKEASINANFQNSSTHISDYARAAEKPLYPNVPLNLGLAFGLSLLFSVASVILYDTANDKLQDLSQLTSLFNIEVLGVIPSFRDGSKLAVLESPASVIPIAGENAPLPAGGPGPFEINPIAAMAQDRRSSRYRHYQEAIKMLWSSFQLTNFGNKYRSLMITSAISGEGKTTISYQFALANARHDRKTLLIDADLRRPSTHRVANLPVSPGVADAINAPELWRNFVRVSPLNPNLHIMPAGITRRGSPDDLIPFLPQLLAATQDTYDLVIVDSPPLLSFAESLHMATAVDGVLVVACADKTSRAGLRSVLQTLNRLRSPVTGIVLNRAHQISSDSYYSYAQYRAHDLEASA